MYRVSPYESAQVNDAVVSRAKTLRLLAVQIDDDYRKKPSTSSFACAALCVIFAYPLPTPTVTVPPLSQRTRSTTEKTFSSLPEPCAD